jgi:hypothetical protein
MYQPRLEAKQAEAEIADSKGTSVIRELPASFQPFLAAEDLFSQLKLRK